MKRLLAASVALAALAAATGASAEPFADAAVPVLETDFPAVETVIVTAARNVEEPAVVARVRERLSRTPGAVNTVAAEVFENRTAQGVSDLLRDVPGVLAQKRYGEESRLSIRGSGLAQGFHQRGVLLAQDGVPFADADGFSDFQGVDLLSARYAEVYRGGNAIRFGGAQLGGAVNLVTANGKTAKSEGLVRLEGGSFGTARGQLTLGDQLGDWDGYLNVSGLVADGWREQSDQSQARATVNLGRSFGDDREVRLIVYGADVQQEVPGSLTLNQALNTPRVAPAVNRANDYARDLSILRTTLQTRWRLGESLLFEGAVYGTTKSLYHPIFQVLDQESRGRGAFGRLDWTGELGGREADLFVGLSWRASDLKAKQFVNAGGLRGAQTADGVQQAAGLDLFAEGRLFVTERLALVAGGSFGRAERDYSRDAVAGQAAAPFAADTDFEWFSPRFGLLWQADDRGPQVYANLTRSVEPPTFGALVQGASPAFVPVKPQEAWTGEVGTRGRKGRLTWDVTLYRAEIEGEILNFSVGPDVPAATFNAGSTIHQGLEAALDWRVPGEVAGGKLMLRQSYAWSDFRFDGDRQYGDNRLPVAPEHQYRATLLWSGPKGVFLAPSVEWRISEPWVDYANTAKAPAYAVWSLNAGWELKGGTTLFLDARNLLDERYVGEFAAVTDARLASVNKAVFHPGEGRALFAGVRRRF